MSRTTKLRITTFILGFLSFCLTFGPLSSYIIVALKSGASDNHKITLCMFCTIGLVIGCVCLFKKIIPRSLIWLIIIGLWLCLENILGCVLFIAITQVADELIIHPLYKYFKNKTIINSEIDKRLR